MLSINKLTHEFFKSSLYFSTFFLALISLSSNLLANIVPAPPTINASSYILIDAKTNTTLIEHNASLRIPPASLTKIMTSYITEYEIEQGNIMPSDRVPISIKAWKKGGSRMYVQEGTKVPLIDLLRGIIIQSGNDASIAVAEYIAGSEDSFADLMNQHAKRLGMKNSHFVNATGWPAKNHYSTAQDLAILSRALIRDFPQHYSIYGEKSFTYNDITQPNRNTLLGWNDSVDGIKTGYTEEAGYCLVASAFQKNMRLISVVTGTASTRARAEESQKLITYGTRFFESVTIAQPHTSLKNLPVWKGLASSVNLGVAEEWRVTLPRGTKDSVELKLSYPETFLAPLQKGQEAGEALLLQAGKTIQKRPLVHLETVEKAGILTRIWHSIWLFFSGLFG